MKTVQEIRESFCSYFRNKDHLVLESASLFPAYDPTLLFTTAGMVPFKPYFVGTSKPPSLRVASIQKCMRTTDLSEVGKTKRHLSFFEMLGNFSFGDYFKKEAVEFAWEYSTDFLGFPPEQIWVTVYLDDDEAFSLWKNHIGVPEQKISRLGKKDNFWGPAGSVGACGPCSELYLDRGSQYDPEGKCPKPGDDGERFLEFWNLVFNQYNKNEAGEYRPLQKKGVDTGAGLERIASLLQNVENVFETNELALICEKISHLYNAPYRGENKAPIHILSDHIRTVCFSIADGIFPSNESRGYVLRRMLRRAMIYGKKLNPKKNFLHQAVEKIVEIYGNFYSGLVQQEKNIYETILSEEQRFTQTLQTGSEKLENIMEASQKNAIIKGKDAFLLYDTYGFPLEMTIELAEHNQLGVDMNGFEEEMEKQRQKGRRTWKGDVNQLPLEGLTPTHFTGYENFKSESKLLRIIYNQRITDELSEEEMKPHDKFYMITNQTPFYPEGGGQSGDEGQVYGSGFSAAVTDTQKEDDIILHICGSLEGKISVGTEAFLEIDPGRRKNLAKNHSATHLLNAALQKNLGAHIRQTGSLVSDTHLRFDFSHPKPLTPSETESVEKDINRVISQSSPVITQILPKKEAEKKGAVMTFGEKYGEVVRVVEMGGYSMEFCAGTHVSHTSDIQNFLIVKESSPGAGNRRIEAVSGQEAFDMVKKTLEVQRIQCLKLKNQMSEKRNASLQNNASREKKSQQTERWNQLDKRIAVCEDELGLSSNQKKGKGLLTLWQELRRIRADMEVFSLKIRKEMKKKSSHTGTLSSEALELILNNPQNHDKITYYHTTQENWDIPALKSAADALRERKSEGIYILKSFIKNNNEPTRCNLLLAASRSFVSRNGLDLGKTIKKALECIKNFHGGGGGRPEIAQASGYLKNNVDFSSFETELHEQIMGKL